MVRRPLALLDRAVVPRLVGLNVAAGRNASTSAGLTLAEPPDADVDVGALSWPGEHRIVSQQPPAGRVVRRRTVVVVRWAARPGGDPDRGAQTRPKPATAVPVPDRKRLVSTSSATGGSTSAIARAAATGRSEEPT